MPRPESAPPQPVLEPVTLARAGRARLKRIVLEEAGAERPEHPDRYVVIAPLDGDGRLDAAAWREREPACGVTREGAGGGQAEGRLWHGARAGWFFRFDEAGGRIDEAAFQFHLEALAVGGLTSIRRRGRELVLRVISVAKA